MNDPLAIYITQLYLFQFLNTLFLQNAKRHRWNDECSKAEIPSIQSPDFAKRKINFGILTINISYKFMPGWLSG